MSVPAYWYRRSDLRPWLLGTSAGRSRVRNFGDEFCRDFLAWWTGAEPRRSLVGRRRVVVGGSILHLLRKGDVVLSVGARAPGGQVPDGLSIFGARGPLTLGELVGAGYRLSQDELFLCDIGVLAPEVLGAPETVTQRTLLLPHFKHQAEWTATAREYFPSAVLAAPTAEPRVVARMIGASERIVTSSLHGVIFGAAYGREVAWVEPPSDEPPFKFHDFFAAFSSRSVEPLNGLREAARGGSTPLPSVRAIEARKSELPGWRDLADRARRR